MAGLPTQILALVDQEPLLCLPGRSTDTVRFRVANSEGRVPQIRVGLEALGELDGVSPALAITNSDGEVSARGICPTQLFQQDSALRAVVERELGGNLSASVAVEVRADTVTRIEITADAANPSVIRTGETLRFTAVAYDNNNVPVLHPVGSDDPLRLRLGFGVQGQSGRLRIGGEGIESVVPQAVDGEGRLALELEVDSPPTYGVPIQLKIQTSDGAVGALETIHVSAEASAIALNPAALQAVYGGSGGGPSSSPRCRWQWGARRGAASRGRRPDPFGPSQGAAMFEGF